MATNLQESFPTSELDSTTILHLQRLIFLNNKSRDAYQVAVNLSTYQKLVALAEQAALEGQTQAVTLQNILWFNCTASKSESSGDIDRDRRTHKVQNESPQRRLVAVVDALVEIDEEIYACYEKVKNAIQGRGIRQLLTEQALRIQRRQKNMLDLRQEIAKQNSSESKPGS